MKQKKDKQDLEGKFFPVLDAVLRPVKEVLNKSKSKKKLKKKVAKNKIA